MIATQPGAMFALGLILGSLSTAVAYTVYMTLQEARYGYAKKRIEHKYSRRPPQIVKHMDPIIRKAQRDHNRL